jgi:hypothetical protein
MGVYILMAVVLVYRRHGLFSAAGG